MAETLEEVRLHLVGRAVRVGVSGQGAATSRIDEFIISETDGIHLCGQCNRRASARPTHPPGQSQLPPLLHWHGSGWKSSSLTVRRTSSSSSETGSPWRA